MTKRQISAKPITMKELGEFTEQVILPGVEEIVGKVVEEKIEEKIKPLHEDMKAGFADMAKSIRVLSGDIAEIKEQQKEFKEDHESRLRLVERKVGVR